MAELGKVVLQAESVSRTYKQGSEKVAAVRGVSLRLFSGELVAIVGPSGSGKTSLAHLLGGLASPDEGVIRFNGEPLKRSDKGLSEFRNQAVGFVFQHFDLLPSYSALENVALPLVIAGVKPAKRREKAFQYLKIVGLETKAKRRVTQLSGGERQRVAIARALVNHPQILIADEPTGNLDSRRAKEIMTVLEALSHKRGLAVVMVTHDESLAARADRVIHILDGKIRKEAGRA